MNDKILHKRSLTNGSIPTTSSLEYGELAINVADGAIYLKKSGSSGDTIERAITTNSTSSGDIHISGSLFATSIETQAINVDADTIILTGSILVQGQIETIGITGSLRGTADTASYIQWNDVDNTPIFVSQSLFNSYTSSINPRLVSLESESGSIRSTFNSYTESNDTTNITQNNRLTALEQESGSVRTTLNTYTSSTNLRLVSLETESGSIRGVFNSYTGSNDLRVQQLEIESASVRTTFNSYTQSNDNVNTTQNSRLDQLSTESGSIRSTVNSYTQSTDLRINSLEIESSSMRTTFNSYTQSNDIINSTQNSRLNQLSTESGSIRTTVNTYTQSNDLRVQSLEIESASVRGRLGNIEQFSSSQLILNPTFATTGSNTFVGNQIISASLGVSSSLIVKGNTSFGDSQTDTHHFTGSFSSTGSFTVNGLIYPNVSDGEFTFFQHDGNGNITLQYVETLYETVYNPSVTQILKGTPLYVSGSEGASARVFPAEASDPTKMPVIYISADNIEPATEGRGILLGLITGVNTTGYGPGTEVFVGPNGGWTSVRPTGSAIIQSLGIVTKEGNGGQGVVLNPGPSNIPNLNSGHFWIGNGNWTPTPIPTASFTSTASFNEYTSSANSRLNQLSTESGSIRSTLNSYSQSTNLRLDTIESETSSYARIDTNNVFSGLQTFTNINVDGTASFAYIQSVTGSSTSIGDAFIILNEDTPASNFAGIKVIDSGSSFTTASFIYDGLNNNWVFQHEGTVNSGSSLTIFGPLSQGGLGTEIGLTQNRIPKAVTDHGHHIGDSNIEDDGIKVSINSSLDVSGNITGSVIKANSGFIGNLTGTASTASYVQWSSIDNEPTFLSQSTFDTFQTQTNNRLSSLETATGSINSSLANIRSFTESIDLRVGKLEVESGSIRSTFNSYTSSNNTTNTTQNSRLDGLSTFTGSASGRLNNIESFTSSINTTIKGQLDVNTVISGSSQIRALTYYKESISNQTSYTIDHNLNELHPIVQVYDTDNEQIIPLRIKSNSVNQILVDFITTFSGSIIVKV